MTNKTVNLNHWHVQMNAMIRLIGFRNGDPDLARTFRVEDFDYSDSQMWIEARKKVAEIKCCTFVVAAGWVDVELVSDYPRKHVYLNPYLTAYGERLEHTLFVENMFANDDGTPSLERSKKWFAEILSFQYIQSIPGMMYEMISNVKHPELIPFKHELLVRKLQYNAESGKL